MRVFDFVSFSRWCWMMGKGWMVAEDSLMVEEGVGDVTRVERVSVGLLWIPPLELIVMLLYAWIAAATCPLPPPLPPLTPLLLLLLSLLLLEWIDPH